MSPINQDEKTINQSTLLIPNMPFDANSTNRSNNFLNVPNTEGFDV